MSLPHYPQLLLLQLDKTGQFHSQKRKKKDTRRLFFFSPEERKIVLTSIAKWNSK